MTNTQNVLEQLAIAYKGSIHAKIGLMRATQQIQDLAALPTSDQLLIADRLNDLETTMSRAVTEINALTSLVNNAETMPDAEAVIRKDDQLIDLGFTALAQADVGVVTWESSYDPDASEITEITLYDPQGRLHPRNFDSARLVMDGVTIDEFLKEIGARIDFVNQERFGIFVLEVTKRTVRRIAAITSYTERRTQTQALRPSARTGIVFVVDTSEIGQE